MLVDADKRRASDSEGRTGVAGHPYQYLQQNNRVNCSTFTDKDKVTRRAFKIKKRRKRRKKEKTLANTLCSIVVKT